MNILFFHEIKNTYTDHCVSSEFLCRQSHKCTFSTLLLRNLKSSIGGEVADEKSRVPCELQLTFRKYHCNTKFSLGNKIFFRNIYMKRKYISTTKIVPPINKIRFRPGLEKQHLLPPKSTLCVYINHFKQHSWETLMQNLECQEYIFLLKIFFDFCCKNDTSFIHQEKQLHSCKERDNGLLSYSIIGHN